MKIIYHNRGHHKEAEKEFNARGFLLRIYWKRVMFCRSIPHLLLKPGKFNKEAFARMKRTAIFINAARGAIHNEDDLTEALKKGIIWGAGLDVTNPEPMRPDHPLLSMPNVCVLPHIGSATEETRAAMSLLAAKNIVAGLKGERLPFVVNPEVYDKS